MDVIEELGPYIVSVLSLNADIMVDIFTPSSWNIRIKSPFFDHLFTGVNLNEDNCHKLYKEKDPNQCTLCRLETV